MKRRGFTLIELMVVIAIIIILAAIAIPNYLSMTARAKKSRVASDFASLAVALETYKTDWNIYPVAATVQNLTTGTVIYKELSTAGAGVATKNVSPNMTAAGDAAPIVYMTSNILDSMKNPYNSANFYHYISADGSTWKLYASTSASSDLAPWVVRTDTTTTLADLSTGTP